MGAKSAKGYLSFTHLEKNGVQTTGTIIERQQTQIRRGSANFDYHIRYEFDNIFAQDDCKVEIKTRITPKEKVCRRTVSKQKVSEAEYKSLSAPSDVKVTYLSNDKGTKSEIMDLGGGKARYVFEIGFFFFLIILSIKVRRVLIKAACEDAYINHLPET